MKVRDTIFDFLSISDQKALKFLAGKPSKALYQASTRRRIMRLADRRESGKSAGMGSSSGDSSCGSANSSSARLQCISVVAVDCAVSVWLVNHGRSFCLAGYHMVP